MLPYIGGKNKMQSFIIPHIPKDIQTYCEPFSGQFWVFFGMDISEYPNLSRVIYNDVNPLNYNLYRCINNHRELLMECEKLFVQEKDVFPTNKKCAENFNAYQTEISQHTFKIGDNPNYEIAAKYVYVLTQVFSGSNPLKSKFIDLKGKYHSKFTSFKNKLKNEKWQKLFEKITHVENLDFEEVIKKYDQESTYYYCDPPYYKVGEGNYYANHEFGRDDHERLINTLKDIRGKFSLSYYEFDELNTWLPQSEYVWKRKQFVKAAAAKKGKKSLFGEELLIMNYIIND